MERSPYPFPLSMYSAPGGLRQDPGDAAESLAEARTCGNGGNMSTQGYEDELRSERSHVAGLYARLDAERARVKGRYSAALRGPIDAKNGEIGRASCRERVL